jgi:hypothetical protein
MTAALDELVITEPGVYDLPADAYHADPVAGGSLSSSGARKLLPPSCPAIYRYEADHPGPARPVWEVGSAAHKLVLGVGPELVLVDRARWDTNEVKAEVAAIRERGAIPLKRPEHDMVHAMADQLRRHPWARALFQPGTGRAEQTIVWRDGPTGVMCRALLDWLPDPVAGQRFIFRDYKTSAPKSIEQPDRTIDAYGYYVQAAFHLAGLRALGLAGDDAQALIVLQRKEPPYLVRVVQPDPMAMRIGAAKVREALTLFAECRAAGVWPGWSDDVEMVSLPPWTEREYEDLWSQA